MTEQETFHYFDWAATSPQDKDILRESLEIAMEKWGNPSSLHSSGKEAKEILEEARKKCADILGVESGAVFFTSGGTESDHIPLLSVLNRPQKGEVLFSSVEHPAVREMALELKKCGIKVSEIPCGKDGIIKPEDVKNMISGETVLVSVMAVNNETGAIQPVYEIADAIKEATKGKRRPKFHVDCVQAAGKIPLSLNYPGIDSASFSAHKISGPRGIGILYMKDFQEAFLKGGGQEKGIRSGTENVFGAVAFSKVLEKYYISEKNPAAEKRLESQKEHTLDFAKKLSSLKGCSIIPENRIENPEKYSPWVIQASFRNIPGQVMLRALDAEGFCISTGSACSAKKSSRPVLDAMKVPKDISENAVRFSFGHSTEKQAMDELFQKVKEINRRFNPQLNP